VLQLAKWPERKEKTSKVELWSGTWQW